MNRYQVIDEENWKRNIHCRAFRNSLEPGFCITVELDITHFLTRVKTEQKSFTFSLIHLVAKCANKIEEFRYRFVDGKVVLFEKIDTAFTYLREDTELFKVVNVSFVEDLEEYIHAAQK